MADRNTALEQAADWQIRLQENPHEREAFERWLHSEAEHEAAWQRMQRMWGALGELAPLPAPVVAPVHQLRPRPRKWIGLAIAAGLAAVAVFITPEVGLAWRADYATAVDQTRTIDLADGSVVTLAPGSALNVDSSDTRHVELVRGQAYFQVSHDPSHPFIARAGALSVRVLGTRFDLDLQDGSAQVTLEQGKVIAESTGLPVSETLKPGESLRLDWPSGRVERSSVDPSQVAIWRQGSLFVENQTVAAIVSDLQRYVPGWIIIADPALAQRRITGVFDLQNPDRALQALAQSLAVESRQMTPWVRTLGSF